MTAWMSVATLEYATAPVSTMIFVPEWAVSDGACTPLPLCRRFIIHRRHLAQESCCCNSQPRARIDGILYVAGKLRLELYHISGPKHREEPSKRAFALCGRSGRITLDRG